MYSIRLALIHLTVAVVVTTRYSANAVVQEEVLRYIYQSCCLTEEACVNWQVLGNDTLVKDIDVCDLNGIECNENSNIIQIDASGFGLECGSQIQQLQLLDHLQRLDLSNNQLTGIIPYYLSESLAHLNLDDNMLVGSIPVPYATHPTLTTLSVSNNKLTDLPVEWEYLVYKKGEAGFPLKYVNVAGNSLEGSFPQGLAFYPLLETLDVSNNQLTGELGPKGYSDAFQSVQSLNVQNNKLQGPIPEWALYISNLSTSGNAFGAFPKEDDSTSTSGLSPGAIAGIVIGTILGIGLIFTATIIAWKKYNTRKEAFQRYDDTMEYPEKPLAPPASII